jgi:Zn-dependent M28 family amino/carboxypeptidase
MGLLGSKYFAAYPIVGFEKLMYNLNIDNGGIDDTSSVDVMGLGRASANEDLKRACSAYGLELAGDPAPEQVPFARSDNISFAARGVPAPSFG